MIHSCEAEGGVHILDERIPEWRLLQDIRPLFASSPPRYKHSLPWILEPYNKDSDNSDVQTWTIKARNDFNLFKHELQELPETAPEGELSCETFEDCLKHLCNLLDLLDQLIKDSVLGHKLSSIETGIFSVDGQGQGDHSRAPADDGTEEAQGSKSSASVPIDYMRLRPRQGLTNFFPKRIKTPFRRLRKVTSSVVPSKRPKIGSAPMDNAQNYLKIRALGNIVNAISLNGANINIVGKCAAYINLEQTAEVYAKGSKILEACNAWFESPDVSASNLPKLLHPINIPRTNWKDSEPAIASNQLFEILSKNVHACADETGHQAMLCLSDIQLNARPLIFNLFFLTCKYPSYWQDSRFNTISNYRDTRREAHSVKNLCNLIYKYRQELQLNSTALNLFFDKEQLFVTKTGLLVHRGVFPTISLKELLTDGYFRKPTAGGAFGPRDKAVLALSLSRCLLHLLQGPWIKEPWTADSFQFLHNKETAELLDVHHPYVRWPRKNFPTRVETTESDTVKYREIFLEFACLLLEIQIGETIALDQLPSMDLEDKEDILYEKADNLDIDEPLAHYCGAVTGCLKFKALLASYRKSDGKSSPGEQIRKVIYTNVITPLEQHFSIFPNPKTLQTQRNLQLQDRLINSVQPMEDSNAQGEPQVQHGPLSTSGAHFETQRDPNEGSSYAEDFILSNLRALEDPRYPNFEKTLKKTEAAGIGTSHDQNHTSFRNRSKSDAYNFAVLYEDDWPSGDSQNDLKEHHIALLKQKLESIHKLVAPMSPSDGRFYTGVSTWDGLVWGTLNSALGDDLPVTGPYWFRANQNKSSNEPKGLEAILDEKIIQPLVVEKIRNGGFKEPLIVIVLLGKMTVIKDENYFKKAILSCRCPNDTDGGGGTTASFIFSGASSIIHKPTKRFLSRLGKCKELKEWVICSTRDLDENCAVMRRAVDISAAYGNPYYAKQLLELLEGVLED
ncbi:hypothetical protein TWF192_006183 [Orbilia oligospora]|uniref:DUF7580 domain-containing protein n=1 Tax=Orbilia oligospora TaxID=2813651 RepID=A0A6G1M8M0_ORBOL|nr:hypothetical protein TWF191_006351 [Orbilia oligospora]KAF3248789.1 hypothetical protein TWF192_006183 [Orbilia oligospora]